MAARWVSRVLMIATMVVIPTARSAADPQAEGKSRADEFRDFAKGAIAHLHHPPRARAIGR